MPPSSPSVGLCREFLRVPHHLSFADSVHVTYFRHRHQFTFLVNILLYLDHHIVLVSAIEGHNKYLPDIPLDLPGPTTCLLPRSCCCPQRRTRISSWRPRLLSSALPSAPPSRCSRRSPAASRTFFWSESRLCSPGPGSPSAFYGRQGLLFHPNLLETFIQNIYFLFIYFTTLFLLAFSFKLVMASLSQQSRCFMRIKDSWMCFYLTAPSF